MWEEEEKKRKKRTVAVTGCNAEWSGLTLRDSCLPLPQPLRMPLPLLGSLPRRSAVAKITKEGAPKRP